jgi:hypothetical protein
MRDHAVCILICTLALIVFPTGAGGQWARVGDPDGGWITCLAPVGDNLFAATKKGGVFLSMDGGVTWKAVNSGLPPATEFQCLAAVGTALFAGSLEHGAYSSSDNGATWRAASAGLPAQSSVWRFAQSGPALFAVAGPKNSTVYRSGDGGTSWTPANSGLGEVQVTDLAAIGMILYAGTSAGVFRSSNEGAGWTKIADQSPCSRLAAVDKAIFAGSSVAGRVIWTPSDGAGWKEASQGLPDAEGFMRLDFMVSGPYIFLGSSRGVFVTSVKSELWMDVSAGLSDKGSVRSLAAGRSHLFAGTEKGEVWRLPLSDLSLTINLSDPVLTDELWKRIREKTPHAVIIPDVVRAAMQEGLVSGQGRSDIPFSIFKILTLPSRDFPGSIFGFVKSQRAVFLLPERWYDPNSWRYAVLFFNLNKADLDIAPGAFSGAREKGLAAHDANVDLVNIFIEFRQTDSSGSFRVVREVFVPLSFERNSATYDPSLENWYTIGYNLRPGKYTVVMAITAPANPGAKKRTGDEFGRIGVAYVEIELPATESYQTTLGTTSIFFIRGKKHTEASDFATTITGENKGWFLWSKNEVTPFIENVVPPGSKLDLFFDVLGARPKISPGPKANYDLEVAYEVRQEGGQTAIFWAPQRFNSTFVESSLPLTEDILIKDDKGERWGRRNLGAGKYALVIDIKDKVTGLTAEKQIPFEIR